MSRQYNQLPQVAFCILLALSLRQRHGYEIMKQVAEDSQGKVKLVPGALYASIKNLSDQGLIQKTIAPEDPRRKYYKLTAKGKRILNTELEYYDNTLKLARQRKVYEATLGIVS